MILKLLLFMGLFFVWRAVFRMARRRSETKTTPPAPDADYQDLTSQEISDAEFEDLPDEPS